MTRKRTGNSLVSTFLEHCPMCEGSGMIKSAQTICFEVLRAVSAFAKKTKARKITVTVNPSVMSKLYENEKMLNALESKIKKKINIKMQDGFYPEYFEIL
jgi:ribonuclease G